MMKKCHVTLLVLGCLCILAGCGDSPKSVAQKWRDAIVSGDVKTANALHIAETKAENDLIVLLMKANGDNAEINALKAADLDKVTIKDELAYVTSGNDKEWKTTVVLTQRNGKWLVLNLAQYLVRE